MSSNNQLLIYRKQNGLYRLQHIINVESESDGVTLADDIDGLDEAVEKANAFMEENEVEYGLQIITR